MFDADEMKLYNQNSKRVSKWYRLIIMTLLDDMSNECEGERSDKKALI